MIYNVTGASVGTFASWTMIVEALNVTLFNVAVANNADGYDHTKAAQSVALHLNGGKSLASPQRVRVVNCSIWGGQDTVYLGPTFSMSYFFNTYINGTVGEEEAIPRAVRWSERVRQTNPPFINYGFLSYMLLLQIHCLVKAPPSLSSVSSRW